jgi:hypothetical protein
MVINTLEMSVIIIAILVIKTYFNGLLEFLTVEK